METKPLFTRLLANRSPGHLCQTRLPKQSEVEQLTPRFIRVHAAVPASWSSGAFGGVRTFEDNQSQIRVLPQVTAFRELNEARTKLFPVVVS